VHHQHPATGVVRPLIVPEIVNLPEIDISIS
jgi:hypothetical protein